MAFLTLNGVTIPIEDADASEAGYVEIGDASRGVTNRYTKSRRAQRRRWKFRTTRLPEADFLALRAFIAGRGHGFPWDANRNSAGGLNELPGQVSSFSWGLTPSAVGTLATATVVNGAKFFSGPGSFAGGAIAIDEASQNILTAGSSQATNVADFVAVDSAGLVDTGTRWEGSVSQGGIQVTPAAGVGGVRSGIRTVSVAALPLTQYAASAYVRRFSGSIGANIAVFLRDETNGINSADALTNSFSWNRCEDILLTTGAAVPVVSLYVVEAVADALPGTFLVDGFQIEPLNHSTAWMLGGTSRASGSLAYPVSAVRGYTEDITVNVWTTTPELTVAPPGRVLLNLRSSGAFAPLPRLRIDIPGGGLNQLDFKSGDASGVETVLTATSPFTVGSNPPFIMVTAVVRKNPRVGQNKLEFWINGTMVASANPALTPTLENCDAFNVGGDASSNYDWSGAFIDDLVVVPYAATPSMIAAWYNAGTGSAQATQPALVASGDYFGGDLLRVRGLLGAMPYSPYSAGASGFLNNARQIEFELEEL